MARLIDGVSNVKTLKHTHDAAVEAGDVIVEAGIVLVAVNDADADEENVWAFAGRMAFDKATGVGTDISAPTLVYYDSGAEVATDEDSGNYSLGLCIEDAETTDDEVIVEVNQAW